MAVSVLLYGCTTWTLTKRLENKIDGSCTRMLRAALNKSWKQHPTKKQLYGHLPPITQTIRERRTRHAGHCWRSNELISDVLLWAPTHGRTRPGRPTKTYIEQLSEDSGCHAEDLPRAMSDREEWRKRVMAIRATSTTRWWWYYIYIYIYKDKNLMLNFFYWPSLIAKWGGWSQCIKICLKSLILNCLHPQL